MGDFIDEYRIDIDGSCFIIQKPFDKNIGHIDMFIHSDKSKAASYNMNMENNYFIIGGIGYKLIYDTICDQLYLIDLSHNVIHNFAGVYSSDNSDDESITDKNNSSIKLYKGGIIKMEFKSYLKFNGSVLDRLYNAIHSDDVMHNDNDVVEPQDSSDSDLCVYKTEDIVDNDDNDDDIFYDCVADDFNDEDSNIDDSNDVKSNKMLRGNYKLYNGKKGPPHIKIETYVEDKSFWQKLKEVFS
jgi:hypothetical protein